MSKKTSKPKAPKKTKRPNKAEAPAVEATVTPAPGPTPAEPVVSTPPASETTPVPSAAPAVAEKPAKPARPPAEQRNGVKKPGPGKCRDVWDALDDMLKAGTTPATKDARQLAKVRGWNENNTTIELARWRKFNGLSKPVKEAAK